jgi:hypothetical protein
VCGEACLPASACCTNADCTGGRACDPATHTCA